MPTERRPRRTRRSRRRYRDSLSESLNATISRLKKAADRPLSARAIARVANLAWERTLQESIPEVVREMEGRTQDYVHKRARDERRLNLAVRATYKEPLNRLLVLHEIFMEVTDKFFQDNHLKPHDPSSPKFIALMQLYARSSRIICEIATLLRNGLADGAHARWRALHECVVTAQLIATHDAELAVRYLNHETIQRFRAGEQYNKYHRKHGMRRIDARTMRALQRDREVLVSRFGSSFSKEYGWASSITGKAQPQFKDLQTLAGYEHFQPVYRWASEQNHAGPRGLQPLGHPRHGKGYLLAGPSTTGLAHPGIYTANSILHLSISLEWALPSLDNHVATRGIRELSLRCETAFADAETD